MAAGLVALAVMAPMAASRGSDPPDYTPPQAAATTTTTEPTDPSTPPTSIAVPTEPQLLVFGDSYVEGNGADSPESTFARVAATELGWPVETDGEGGTGFVNGGPDGDRSYPARVAKLQPETEPNVIVVEGGINDRGDATQVTSDAVATLEALRGQFPGAVLVLMGPVNPDPPNRGADAVTGQLRAAAVQVQVPFIDASGWITVDNIGDYTLGDDLHVNQAGHDYIGRRLAEALLAMAG